MSGYHCKYCGKVNMPEIEEFCNCEGQLAELSVQRDLIASIIMRDPVKREGYTETRSNEEDERAMWSAIDNVI